MPKILLNFLIILQNFNIPKHLQLPGPLFHRWLPDGMKDAIILDTGDPNAELKIWFERMGFVDKNGFIKFDSTRREVDPEVIPTQAIHKAGPLYGSLEIRDISDEELNVLLENKVNDENYIKFGKKIVNKLLYPPVARFISIFHSNYGQYWVQELEKWDSREESLGHYCMYRLNLHWSIDNGKTWLKFKPNNPETRPIEFKIDFTPKIFFYEYPTREDWQELNKVVEKEYEPPLASTILSRANQYLDQGNLRQALIEGASALDVAISEFFRQKLDSDKPLYSYISELKNMSVSARLIIIATSLGKIPKHDIENAVEAIKIRNNVVHDGKEPPENAKDALYGLFNIIRELLSGPRCKFPSINPGNLKMSHKEWERYAQREPHNGNINSSAHFI